MLSKVLKSICKYKTIDIWDIASEMHISRDMTYEMIRDLVRMGYLKQLKTEKKCSGCPGCGESPTCSQAGRGRWILTEKGEHYVQSE